MKTIHSIVIRCIYVFRLRSMLFFIAGITSFLQVSAYQQQTRTITGTITDETNAPLPGVNIQVKRYPSGNHNK